MTRSPFTDAQLGPIIRDVFEEMIDELPASFDDAPIGDSAMALSPQSPTRSAGRLVAVAAAVGVLVVGLTVVASLRGDDSAVTDVSTPPATDDDRTAGEASNRWAEGVRMIVYVSPGAPEESLEFIADSLDSFPNFASPDGVRYLGPDESLDEARRLLVDDPVTLELLTVENIPTAFYITPVEGVSYDDLFGAAAVVENLPSVLRVDIDPQGQPVIPGVPALETVEPSAGVAVTTSLPESTNFVVEDPLAPGAWSGVRTSEDGSSLIVFFVGAAEYQPGDQCSMRYIPTVEESDTEVHVAFRGERPGSSDGGETYSCRLIGYSRSVTVDLSQPLGDRTLIVLGEQRDVFDGSTLTQPEWLPDGWQISGEQPAFPGPSPSASWARTWTPPRPEPGDGACEPADSGFTLFEGAADLVDAFPPEQGETVASTYDINGTIATYSSRSDLGIARLSWTLGDRGYVLKTTPQCEGDQPPTPETMLRFARNLAD